MFWIENDFLLDSSAEACRLRVLRRPLRAPAPEFLGRLTEALAPLDCPRTAASLRSSLCLRVIYSFTHVCMYIVVLVCTALCMEMFLKEHFCKYASPQPARSSGTSSPASAISATSSSIKANASWGTGFCQTGAKDWRGSGGGPSSRRAAR